VLTKNWLGTVEGGYHHEYPLKEHYYYLMTYWDRTIGKRNNFSFSLFLSGMSAEKLQILMYQPYIYVKDDIIYSDSNVTSPITETFYLSNSSVYGTIESERNIPQDYWGVNPNLRYEYKVSKRVSMGLGGNYMLTWYRSNYTWIEYRPYRETIPTTGIRNPFQTESFLAYNTDDGGYYWVNSIQKSNRQLVVQLDSIPVIFYYYNERRVDQSLTLNLFFKYRANRFGSFTLDLTARRSFSTLMKLAPVDIERWYGALTLTWFFRFKPDYGP
jgi:hypothetical protein